MSNPFRVRGRSRFLWGAITIICLGVLIVVAIGLFGDRKPLAYDEPDAEPVDEPDAVSASRASTGHQSSLNKDPESWNQRFMDHDYEVNVTQAEPKALPTMLRFRKWIKFLYYNTNKSVVPLLLILSFVSWALLALFLSGRQILKGICGHLATDETTDMAQTIEIT